MRLRVLGLGLVVVSALVVRLPGARTAIASAASTRRIRSESGQSFGALTTADVRCTTLVSAAGANVAVGLAPLSSGDVGFVTYSNISGSNSNATVRLYDLDPRGAATSSTARGLPIASGYSTGFTSRVGSRTTFATTGNSPPYNVPFSTLYEITLGGGVVSLYTSPSPFLDEADAGGNATYAVDFATLYRFAGSSRDLSFGSAGVVPVTNAHAVAPLADGSVIVASDGPNVLLRHYTATGMQDPSFGAGGVASLDVDGYDTPADLVVDSQGRIVVLIDARPGQFAGGGMHAVIARLLPDGQLDAAFGGGMIDLSPTIDSIPTSVQISGNSVYVVDDLHVSSSPSVYNVLAVFKLQDDGSPDNAFGIGGASLEDLGGDYYYSSGSMITPTGDLLVAANRLYYKAAVVGFRAGDGGCTPRSGYWLLGKDGSVHTFGDSANYGSAPAGAVDIASTPTGQGYYTVDVNGIVSVFGDAYLFGNADKTVFAKGEKVVSISVAPSGLGYWLFTDKGRAQARGDASFFGDTSKIILNAPVLDSVATPSGLGYYLVASDGGIFCYGDANFSGSMGGKPLNKPVQSLVPDPDGLGYWLVASDGGVFSFDANFHGSMGGKPLNKPMVGMVAYGDGYLMVAADGGVFDFSSLPFSGSLGGTNLSTDIVSIAALG